MWDNDACMFNCLTHTIFNLTDPQHAYGKFSINNAFQYVNVSILDDSTSAVYTGPKFGCQLSLVNKVGLWQHACIYCRNLKDLPSMRE